MRLHVGRASIRTASPTEVRGLFTTDKPGHVRLPRLPGADPPADVPAHEPAGSTSTDSEEGTTTTPFDMVGAQRPRPLPPRARRGRRACRSSAPRAAYFRQAIRDRLIDHRNYIEKHGEDLPGDPGWRWESQREPRARAAAARMTRSRRRPPKATTYDGAARGGGECWLVNAGSSSLKCSLWSRRTRRCSPHVDRWAGSVTRYEHGRGAKIREARFVATAMRCAALADLRWLSAATERPACGRASHRPRRRVQPRRSGSPPRSRVADRRARPSSRRCTTRRGSRRSAPPRRCCRRVPHVAVFDTAFHATLPPPRTRTRCPARGPRLGDPALRVSRPQPRVLRDAAPRSSSRARTPELRLVICHLGHGCSAAAVIGGRWVDTTMGFTPLDGLMMATRSGSIDPGIVTHVAAASRPRRRPRSRRAQRESGLLGVSGVSADMREVLAAAAAGRARATGHRNLRASRAPGDRRAGGHARRGRCARVHRRRRRTCGRGPRRRSATGSSASGSSSIRTRTPGPGPTPTWRDATRARASW